MRVVGVCASGIASWKVGSRGRPTVRALRRRPIGIRSVVVEDQPRRTGDAFSLLTYFFYAAIWMREHL